MNQQLASLLEEAGKSSVQLARQVNVRRPVTETIHETTPRKWIKGDSKPRGKLPGIVAEILSEWTGRNITVRDLGWTGPSTPISAIGPLNEPWGARAVLQILLAEFGEDVERRTYLEMNGLELASLANPWLLEPFERISEMVGGRRIGSSMIKDINTITATRRKMDDTAGGGMLLPAVREDLRLSLAFLEDARYTAEIGRQLHAAIAEQARLASWLAFDSGQHGLAQHYTALAVKTAYIAEDWQTGSNALAFASRQAAVKKDAVAAESLARAALSGGRGQLTPAVQASIHARLANARARLGDENGFRRTLDEAEALLAASDPANEPPWIYWFGIADLHGLAGEGALEAGLYDFALENLSLAASEMPAEHVRDRALWLAIKATAHAKNGGLDEGRATAEQALTLVRGGLESEHVFMELDSHFFPTLRENDRAAADDFHERLLSHMGAGDGI